MRAFAVLGTLLLSACLSDTSGPQQPRDFSSVPLAYANGDNIRTSDGTFLYFEGSVWRYPDAATVYACTGGHTASVQTAADLGGLPIVGTLPSALAHEWLARPLPVKGSGSAAVYAAVGCILGAVPDPATFWSVFGSNASALEIPQGVLDSMPASGLIRNPIRTSGTLIKKAGSAEVRWITHAQASRAIPSLDVLQSYCRADLVIVSDEEFDSYVPLALMHPASEACGVATPRPGDGVIYRSPANGQIYLSFGGERYQFPDSATLRACMAGHVGAVQSYTTDPPLRDAGALPSATTNRWLTGSVPVKREGTPVVYAVVGCVKSPVPDIATLRSLYSDASINATETVAASILDMLPTGPAAQAPLRRYGTPIKANGAEIRFVTHNGGALSVSSIDVLNSYCGYAREVLVVSDAEFARYATHGTLANNAAICRDRIAFERTSHANPYTGIFTMDPAGGDVQVLIEGSHTRTALQPDWSPDHSQIVFVSRTAIGYKSLNVVNSDGTGERQISPLGDHIYERATWSPDGTRLTYTNSTNNKEGIWIMNADGTGERRITTASAHSRPRFTSTGTLTFVEFIGKIVEVHPDHPNDSRVVLVTEASFILDAAYSPDMTRLAWLTTLPNHEYVLRVREPGGAVRDFPSHQSDRLSWSRDSRFIAFIVRRDDSPTLGTVGILEVATGIVTKLPVAAGTYVGWPAW